MRILAMMRCGLIVLLAVACFGCGCRRDSSGPGGERALSFESAVAALTNVQGMARAPFGTAHLVSTYDRSGGNRDWFTWTEAEKDGLVTMLEAKGPGCVRRIWMTHVMAENWQFFFDGEPEPRLTLTKEELFGGRFPFTSPLSGISGGGHYCYVPLPFRKSIRIAVRPQHLKPDTRTYFHINYDTFPSGTEVESFPGELTESQSSRVRAVARAWETADEQLTAFVDRTQATHAFDLAPNESEHWLQTGGEGRLAGFWVRLGFGDDIGTLQRADCLRQLVLFMQWDEGEGASVQVPLGDFFCNAWYPREYASLPMGYVDGTYVCRLPMPFRRGMRATLANRGPTPVHVETGWALEAGGWAEGDRYFHAVWNASHESGTSFPLLNTGGPGHYVGCFLSAIGMDGSWTILEGDDIFYVDEDPPLHGTGLEDYFNGAWYYSELFDLPTHGLIEKAPIRTDQYRFHIADPIPFGDSFSGAFEFGDGNRAKGYMSGVAYWYMDQPGSPAPGDAALTMRPRDPIEPVAIMAQLFELERAGLYREAIDRCAIFTERFAELPFAGTLELRSLGYRELVEGKDAVLDDYRRIASTATDNDLRQQAADLAWFHEDESNALLGLHISGQYRLFLNGQEVASGDHAVHLRAFRISMQPGTHEWVAAVKPTRPSSFLSLYLRGHDGVETSIAPWEFVDLSDVPDSESIDAATVGSWESFPKGRKLLPNMAMWRFYPNAYVNMQSGRQLVSFWPFWETKPRYRRILLRRRFTWPPEETAEAAPAEVGVEENQARSLDKQGGGKQ